MSDWQDIEGLRALVLDLGLPQHDLAMFGVSCPYCGKNDRIHKLEKPAELDDPPALYSQGWEQCRDQGELVLCKFCRHLLAFDQAAGRAAPLTEG